MDFLSALISKSETSFERHAPEKSLTFLLVMQTVADGSVVGCASVKTNVGTDDFMCADFEVEARNEPGDSQRRPRRRLVLKRTLTGYTEVGSLFLHPQHRAHGAGRFLARARYMLMGTCHSLFDRPIVAQLRGCCDPNGMSPFYEEIWRLRLGATYTENDARLAREGAKFLLDRYGGLEIDLAQLSTAARDVVGRPHDTARGALKLLEQEGFRQSNLVDLADGGPIALAERDGLNSLASASPVELCTSAPSQCGPVSMVSNTSLRHFRACIGPFNLTAGQVAGPAWLREVFEATDNRRVLATGANLETLSRAAPGLRAASLEDL
jgi:arginine N-succinyltransferase